MNATVSRPGRGGRRQRRAAGGLRDHVPTGPYRSGGLRRSLRQTGNGADEFAGLRTPAGHSAPGESSQHPVVWNVARRVPNGQAGRAPHPPKAEKDQTKSLNDKDRQLAIRSAIAATADRRPSPNADADRGPQFDAGLDLPLVVSDEFEDLNKTQEALGVLEAVGADADIERAEEGRSDQPAAGRPAVASTAARSPYSSSPARSRPAPPATFRASTSTDRARGQRRRPRAGRTPGPTHAVDRKRHRGGGRPMNSIIEHPIVTEQAMNEMDFKNKLLFLVDIDATKPEIREAIEDRYDVSVVEGITTQNTMDGGKEGHRHALRRTTTRPRSHRGSGCSKMGRRIQGQRRGRGGRRSGPLAPLQGGTVAPERRRRATITGGSSGSNTTLPARLRSRRSSSRTTTSAPRPRTGRRARGRHDSGRRLGGDRTGEHAPAGRIPEGVPVCNVEE